MIGRKQYDEIPPRVEYSLTEKGKSLLPLIDALTTSAFIWIIAEGVCYITGAVFYSINKRKYMHTVFHFFVLAGSICHIIAVWDILMKSSV